MKKTHLFFLNFILVIFSCSSHQSGNTLNVSIAENTKTDKNSSAENLCPHSISGKSDTFSVSKKKITAAEKNIVVKDSADIELLTATAQKWHGGIKGSGGGTYFNFSFIARLSSSFLFVDKAWVGQKFFAVTLTGKSISKNHSFSGGDTLNARITDYVKDTDLNTEMQTGNEPEKQLNIAPPFAYKGAALIGYLSFNNRYYLIVPSFQQLPTLYYP
jgi:hypothetical protein